jgi:hypothetical protein
VVVGRDPGHEAEQAEQQERGADERRERLGGDATPQGGRIVVLASS